MRGVQHQISLLASPDVQIVDCAGLTARCFQARWRPSARCCKRDAKRIVRLHQPYATAQAAVPVGIHHQKSAQGSRLICLGHRALGAQQTRCSCSLVDLYFVHNCMHICPGVLSQPSKTTCGGSVSASVRCSASAVDRFGRSSDASSDTLQRGVPAVLSNLHALYQFSRPHTMLGTFISICSVSLLAMVCVSAFHSSSHIHYPDCHVLVSTCKAVCLLQACTSQCQLHKAKQCTV